MSDADDSFGLPRSRRRLVVRGLALVLVCPLLIVAYALCLGPLRRFRRPLQVVWCRVCRWLAGVQTRVVGTVRSPGPTLFVSNHVSYIDIPVIAEYADATFVAKADVAAWPMFGVAARLTRTIFVHRVGPQAKRQAGEMLARLAAGESLVLFPEGTTSDGSTVAPFKSTLFAIAERPPAAASLAIQPVSICYLRTADGVPLVGPRRELYCWYGGQTMLPHMLRLFGLKGVTVELTFYDPIPIDGVSDRKALARRAHAAVAKGIAETNSRLLAEAGGGEPPAGPLSPSPPEAVGATDRSEPALP